MPLRCHPSGPLAPQSALAGALEILLDQKHWRPCVVDFPAVPLVGHAGLHLLRRVVNG